MPIDVYDLREQLPAECPVTIDHAQVHLNCAIESMSDEEQMRHDSLIAGCILLLIGLNAEKE